MRNCQKISTFWTYKCVCLFQGWYGYRACPVPPLPVCICRYPQSREFPLHRYCGSGTRTIPYKKISSNLSCKFSDTEKKKQDLIAYVQQDGIMWRQCVWQWRIICVWCTHTLPLCTTTYCTQKQDIYRKQKHSWNEDPCAISREKWYYQLAHQVCKTRQTRQWKLRAYI